MSQTGSNLRLSHLHPLRPSHTDQSQGSKCVTDQSHTHTQAKCRSPPAHWSVGLEKCLGGLKPSCDACRKIFKHLLDLFQLTFLCFLCLFNLNNKDDWIWFLIKFLQISKKGVDMSVCLCVIKPSLFRNEVCFALVFSLRRPWPSQPFILVRAECVRCPWLLA